MRILQCKDSVFFYNTCNKTKKNQTNTKKNTSGTITGPGHLHHDYWVLTAYSITVSINAKRRTSF